MAGSTAKRAVVRLDGQRWSVLRTALSDALRGWDGAGGSLWINYNWNGKSVTLWVIDTGYFAIGGAIAGGIIGMMA